MPDKITLPNTDSDREPADTDAAMERHEEELAQRYARQFDNWLNKQEPFDSK